MPNQTHAPAILNTLTAAEIEQFRLEAERTKQGRGSHPGVCLWCERKFLGRQDKVFCTASCKAQYHKAAIVIELDKAQARIRGLEADKQELLAEVSALRKELETNRA
jgi:hypothetical protein